MNLPPTPARTLAATLEDWLQERRRDMTETARIGGLSRQTLYDMKKGKVVGPETLRKVAKGLATDESTDEFDLAVYAHALEDLFSAAGYPPPVDGVVRVQLEDEMRRLVKNRATAEEMSTVLRNFSQLHRDDRILIETAFRIARERLERADRPR